MFALKASLAMNAKECAAGKPAAELNPDKNDGIPQKQVALLSKTQKSRALQVVSSKNCLKGSRSSGPRKQRRSSRLSDVETLLGICRDYIGVFRDI